MIDPYLPGLLLAYGVFMIGLITPGPNILAVIGHVVYAVAFSTPPVVAAYGKARRWVETALGVYFCLASYKLVTYRP